MKNYDYIIIGAGIVGLATALNLFKIDPKLKILILEKEGSLGRHQTGNNSGVIHSGIYYRPGSNKAINCKRGYKLLIDFCNENEVNYELCGKLIVATNKIEEKSLNDIYYRGQENGLSNLKILNESEINEYEPYAIGTKAIFVPQAGIIDYNIVLKKYAEILGLFNCEILLNSEVENLIEKSDEVNVLTNSSEFSTKYLIGCAGLQSDRLARKSENKLNLRIIPFRGEYYKLKKNKEYMVNSLIYPVPDPSFPFLGVHFTKKVNGEVEAGPNAVLAFMREGYKKNSFDIKDFWEIISWPGFQKVAYKYWATGLGEFYRSYNKNAFTRALKKLIPEIEASDLEKGGAGVRAQACDRNGKLLDDFCFKRSNRILHVCNAPSPAATASLAIGEKISKLMLN